MGSSLLLVVLSVRWNGLGLDTGDPDSGPQVGVEPHKRSRGQVLDGGGWGLHHPRRFRFRGFALPVGTHSWGIHWGLTEEAHHPFTRCR